MEDVDKGVWADGLRFESQYYDFDREPSFFSPSDLSDDLRVDRAARLEGFTPGRLPEDMQMMVAVAACYESRAIIRHPGVSDLAARLTGTLDLAPGTELVYHAARINQMLRYFAEQDVVHTPLDWMVRYMSQMPDVIQKQVEEAEIEVIFSVIGAAGSLARLKPSTVAAAVLVHILERQAEPYLCGFDLMDVATGLAEIRKILDCRM